MSISATAVKELRERTGAGMMDCKKALSETQGDFDKAIEYLRKKGIANAAKKEGRAAQEGTVSSYIHAGGRVGVLLEVNCETDFVARTDQFQNFVRDLAMHIAAANPRWVNTDQVPSDALSKEKEIIVAQLKEQGKPENMLEKIAEGKLSKFYDENCLMRQKFVKDTDKSIEQYLKETIGSLGENIVISRFARFALGEGSASSNGAEA